MGKLLRALPLWAAALWWGSLTTVGFMVVPQLFAHLPTMALAGQMAARLFATQTWVSLACGLALLMASRYASADYADDRMALTRYVVLAGLLTALLSQFAVAPHIIARDNLPLWHSVGTALYAVQWACAAVVLHRLRSA